jgi:CHAD domain-containing protein
MKAFPKKEYFSKRLDLILARLERNRLGVLKGKDPEALHDFRVSLRRLRTCLRLLEGCYSPRTLQPVLSLLKGIGQDTNALRDQEVFDALLKSLPPISSPSSGLEAWLRTQEEVRQMREKEVLDYLASPPFVRRLSGLGKKLTLRTTRPKIALKVTEAFNHEQRRLEKRSSGS